LTEGYSIFSIGDSAATIDLGNRIDIGLNRKVMAMQKWFLENRFEGLRDIITAYSSLSVLYDPVLLRTLHPEHSAFDYIKEKLRSAFEQCGAYPSENQEVIRIPVCYGTEFGFDLFWLSEQKGLSIHDIIKLHTAITYRVFMIGFLPGFSYMGEIDDLLVTPRKNKPVIVPYGSVAIDGTQTGIYPVTCPGGWYVLGRTPIRLFDPMAAQPVKFNTGDQVQFFGISAEEYRHYTQS
jgi:inhibitor of KinA